MKKIAVLYVITSVVALTTLLIDHYFVNELQTEPIFLIVCVVLLLFNILRHVNQRVWSMSLLGISSNILLLISTFVGFFLLGISLLGYGISGREPHAIWFVMALSSILLFVLSIIDTRNLYKNEKHMVRK